MGLPHKQLLIDLAEVADAWRLMPRVLLFGYAYMVFETGLWFMELTEPSGSQSAYVSVLWGACAAVTGFYFNTGRKWQ